MEDHRVSMALSGYGTEAEVKAMNLKAFDAETISKIDAFQRSLFTTCYKMENANYNLSQQVADILTAYLILHYPRMKELQANGLAVQRTEAAAINAGASIAELLAWSSHLAVCEKEQHKQIQEKTPPLLKTLSNESKIIEHQSSVIHQLLQHIKRQDERMDDLEAKMDGVPPQDKRKKRQQEPSDEEGKPKRRWTSLTYLHSTWFAWYTQEPRMWQAMISKQQKSNAKLRVVFMKLFPEERFTLYPTAPDYRDHVPDTGKREEEAVLRFLDESGVGSRGSGAVLKHLRALHRSGDLNARIDRHQLLLQTSAIRDPAPGYTQDVFDVVSQ
ncbi:unnamed protein product [Phytophthora fragariaefolia]|uniref:Unnamed protein product n=1 Tax=Phytophthora fragariaefolia TaxID=1490495 RepID=A0A9W6TVW1_9STRA|nr:unnamed protein product [Phytophthora fragariaefolia]